MTPRLDSSPQSDARDAISLCEHSRVNPDLIGERLGLPAIYVYIRMHTYIHIHIY